MLLNPLRVDVAQSATAPLPIEQHVHFVKPAGKRALLGRLLSDPALSRVIVFTRTKRGANQVADALDTGGMRVVALHGNKSQPARQKALEQFRAGRARVLVATLAHFGRDETLLIVPLLHHAADTACRGRLMDLGDFGPSDLARHRCVGVALLMQAGARKNISMQ